MKVIHVCMNMMYLSSDSKFLVKEKPSNGFVGRRRNDPHVKFPPTRAVQYFRSLPF